MPMMQSIEAASIAALNPSPASSLDSARLRSMKLASWSPKVASSAISSSDCEVKERVWNSATASTPSGEPIGIGIANAAVRPSSAEIGPRG